MERVYKGFSLESRRKEKALPVRFDLENVLAKSTVVWGRGSGEGLDTGAFWAALEARKCMDIFAKNFFSP